MVETKSRKVAAHEVRKKYKYGSFTRKEDIECAQLTIMYAYFVWCLHLDIPEYTIFLMAGLLHLSRAGNPSSESNSLRWVKIEKGRYSKVELAGRYQVTVIRLNTPETNLVRKTGSITHGLYILAYGSWKMFIPK